MQNTSKKQLEGSKINIVDVAVAVIYYQEQYLLGFRNSTQHQGNLYEFVGGKIDTGEAVTSALIREVSEETGIDISNNVLVKLGRLHHDYGDKQVCLQVYKVELDAVQYEQHQHDCYGLEGQTLSWVNKTDLLTGHYPLPVANKTILTWLQLPEQFLITYSLTHFDAQKNPREAWLTYHQQCITTDAWVYIRLKTEDSKSITEELLCLRPDIHAILPNDDNIGQLTTTNKKIDRQAFSEKICARHLTHIELMQWFNNSQNILECDQSISVQCPLIISCHDADSIQAANQLAAVRLQQNLPAIIGIFLSPVLATQTHPDSPSLGWEKWSALAQLADMPVIALGGLSPNMFKQASNHGAVSIAGIRNFLYEN